MIHGYFVVDTIKGILVNYPSAWQKRYMIILKKLISHMGARDI